MSSINTGLGYCHLHKHLRMENEGNSGDESTQGRLAQTLTASEGVTHHSISNQGSRTEGETQPQPQQQLALQAFEGVQQHSISNQASETAGGPQPPLQRQSGRPATAQRKRNAQEISDADRADRKRLADKAYRGKKKAEQLKIKSEWEKLKPENEQLKLKIGKLNSKLETLTIQIQNMEVEIKQKNQIIQEKDQRMKSNFESLKAENDQLKFRILEMQNQALKATTEKLEATTAKVEAEKKLLQCENKSLQKDLAIANQSLQTQSTELPRLPYEGLTAPGLQRIWCGRGKLEHGYSLSSLQGRETFLNSISSKIMPFLTPREMDAGRETLRILQALIILVERTRRSHFERLRDRDDLVKELTRIILQVKIRLAAGMHTLRTLRSHFELPRDGGNLDILVRDSTGKIWEFRCCSARVTCKSVLIGEWFFFVSNEMSSK